MKALYRNRFSSSLSRSTLRVSIRRAFPVVFLQQCVHCSVQEQLHRSRKTRIVQSSVCTSHTYNLGPNKLYLNYLISFKHGSKTANHPSNTPFPILSLIRKTLWAAVAKPYFLKVTLPFLRQNWLILSLPMSGFSGMSNLIL